MRPIHTIIHHCLATPEGREVSVATVRKWHVIDNGWADIGYHYLVHLDGKVSECRPLDKVGAHTGGFNTGSIGIAYVGGLASDGKTAKDTRTAAQKLALHSLTATLVSRFPSVKKIAGHRDFSPDKNGNGIIEKGEWLKACPSYDAIPEFAYLLKKAA